MRRLLVVLAIVSIVASGLFVLAAETAAALSKTRTLDTDFAGGTFSATEVVGTGDASIQLSLSPVYGWINMAPASPPSARQGVAMVYDEVNDVVLSFGGVKADGEYSGDLWAYSVSGNSWTNITPTSGPKPSARWNAGFSYDPVRSFAIMMGGMDAGGAKSDIWRYYVTNHTWLQIALSPPSPRNMASTPLTYNILNDRHILAATNTITSAFETWSYNAGTNQWTNMAPSGSVPPATQGHTLTYDRLTHLVLLFGGAEGMTVYGDLWTYNWTANTWIDAVPFTPNVTPNPRAGHTMIFGPHGSENIMFGGIGGDGSYQPGTWLFIGPAQLWSQVMGGVAPDSRRQHAFAWDSALDRVVMYGGQLFDGTITNQTYTWGPGYFTTGQYESTTFDAGCDGVNWQTIWWNSTLPATTTARYKLATSTSDTGPFTFVGWNGAAGSFYNGTPGQAIYSGHNMPPQRFLRWRVYETTGDTKVTPSLHDLGIDYICPATAPYIVTTSPANGATGVPVTADIVVEFSKPMDTTTVSWTFGDTGVTFSASWNSPTDTILTLSHTTPFSECAAQTMEIFGQDQQNHLGLVGGPVPNPWGFQTQCVPPRIETTNPADRAPNVPVDADLVVTFSEPMDTPTVAWTFSDTAITFSDSWNSPTDTILTLSHTTPFATCTEYTARITAGNDLAGLPLTGGGAPNPWTFTTVCPNPYIVTTDPANDTLGVALDKVIVVEFSKQMDTARTSCTLNPSVTLTPSWNSPTDTILSLSHASAFAEVTLYVATCTGVDMSGYPLIDGPVPNPWQFRTVGQNPTIQSTDPPDGATNVPRNKDIIVTFSEAMNTGTVTATISPIVGLTYSWNAPTNTVLTMSHTTLFAVCQLYTVSIVGNDMQGLPLVVGPVPNPFSFTTVCPLLGPGNLRVSLSQPDVQLAWDAVTGATSYKVYTATNRFAAWPAGWTMSPAPASPYLAAGHGADGQTHYYIVRATDGTQDSPNSTMGVKTMLSFGHSTVNTNIAWFSLPYNSAYARASDIANALGSANIDVVGKWDPASQKSVVYYYARGAWRGRDFTVSAGDGLYLGTKRGFSWNITGTDTSPILSFTYNGPPKANVNWISVPYTGVYSKASDISTELGSGKITEVGLWNAATQTVTRWYWSGTGWTGTDFAIAPGAGVYLIIASSFQWTPTLVTPTVP